MLTFASLIDCQSDDGTIGYGLAFLAAETYGLRYSFLDRYGLPGDWEDPETGEPVGVDVGELIAWINSHA
jgi:hypothetical protein